MTNSNLVCNQNISHVKLGTIWMRRMMGYSEMSIYKCSIKKNTNLGGNYISKEAVSECMKLSLHQTTSSYCLHLSIPSRQENGWRKLEQQVQTGDRSSIIFSALILTYSIL